jgi:hypothetical protein
MCVGGGGAGSIVGCSVCAGRGIALVVWCTRPNTMKGGGVSFVGGGARGVGLSLRGEEDVRVC